VHAYLHSYVGILSNRSLKFMEPIIKLISQIHTMNEQTVTFHNQFPLDVQMLLGILNQEERQRRSQELEELLLNKAVTHMRNFDEFACRAWNMGRRVEVDMRLPFPDTPQALRVQDPEIPDHIRLSFLTEVDSILRARDMALERYIQIITTYRVIKNVFNY